jgi:hypothetical protein
MIRSYNHKGFVLEVSIETTFVLVSTSAKEPPRYRALLTISRAGRPVTTFSPLYVAQQRIAAFASAEDALMSAQSAGQTFVDEWLDTAVR